MPNTLKLLTTAIICLILAACASTGNQKLAKMDQSITKQMMVKGQTTQKDILEALGEPNDISFTNEGNEIWTYAYTKSVAKARNFIPYVSIVSSGSNDKHKKIVILFDENKLVKNHSFTEAKGETKVGLIA